MPQLVIDRQSIDVPAGSTVLQAIRASGARLPTLCYWEGLPPYGACRLCLVEMTAPGQVLRYEVYDRIAVSEKDLRAYYDGHMILAFVLLKN